MTTWTTIPDGNLDVDKPARSIDALALRDNPVAIAEGAAGAPRVNDAALSSTATAAGTNWVSTRYASVGAGAVGSLVFAVPTVLSTAYPFGALIAGSSLSPACVRYDPSYGNATLVWSGLLSGTWRSLGYIVAGGTGIASATLWLRIA